MWRVAGGHGYIDHQSEEEFQKMVVILVRV